MSRLADAWVVLRGKASLSAPVIGRHSFGQPARLEDNLESFVKDGYSKNAVLAKCINEISAGAASVPIAAFIGEDRASDTAPGAALERLIERPNPSRDRTQFVREAMSFRLLTGEIFVEAVNLDSQGGELWNKRPDRMVVVPGNRGLPLRYEFRLDATGGDPPKWAVNQVDGYSKMLHLMIPNPVSDWRGLSPIRAATLGIDLHNTSNEWNLHNLTHGGRPPVALIVKDSTGPAREELRKELPNAMGGVDNAREIMVLGGDIEVKRLGDTAVEMDWMAGKTMAAREICYALDYPSFLLGLPGDSTFNNQREARLFLWENTILFHLGNLLGALNRWLVPVFETEGLHLRPMLDEVSALGPRREGLWDRAVAGASAGIITPNEARHLLGFGAHANPEADELLIDANKIPLGTDSLPNVEDDKQRAEYLTHLTDDLGLDTDSAQRAADAWLP